MWVNQPRISVGRKDSCYEELERVLDQFPKYHMRSSSGDFNANVRMEDIFVPINGNES